MANFSVSQVRHLYVAPDYVDGVTKAALTDVGDIEVKKVENELYFLYKSPGGVIKSDYIPLDKLTARAVDAADTAVRLKKVEVTLNANINSGAPVAGQDYILGIEFNGFFSPGADNKYYKDAAVHVTSDIDNAKKFFDAMKLALDASFAREDGATSSSNPYLSFTVSGSGSSAKLVIEEKEQEWVLGTKKARRIDFDVIPSTIYTGGDDLIWGAVADKTGANTNTIKNGKRIADLEWFCMGERGDQYRMVGWPNYVPTTYVADPSKEYHLIEFHYAFTDTGVNSYRTEKEMTIAVPKGASSANYTKVNALIRKINTVAGTSIAILS